MEPTGYLVLEDGTIFPGQSFGAIKEAAGEVVFTTAMTGYQEVITDPSFAGQIVVMTYPHIGNVGVNLEDMEAGRPVLRGLVVRDYCPTPSNWRSRGSLAAFLQAHHIPALSGVDTRALTRRLRTRGVMRGILSCQASDPAALVERVLKVPDLSALDLVAQVTCKTAYTLPVAGASPVAAAGPQLRVALLDCGAKANIGACLVARGCTVTVLPADTPAREILGGRDSAGPFHGVLLSNGPGDPTVVSYAINTVRELVRAAPYRRIPIFGICLGHQILALALGGRTYKLKFGHRGSNHPVKDLATGRVSITTQNHGYAVDAASLQGTGLVVTHISLNDGSVEGLRHETLPIFSVQYHPEASPGPHDGLELFDRFVSLMAGSEPGLYRQYA